MATISENLQTLNEAKLAIKTAIENKGQDLTNVPFTQYAEEIDNIKSTLKQLLDCVKTTKNWFNGLGVYAAAELYLNFEKEATQNVTDVSYMFSSAQIVIAPEMDLQNCENMNNMFYNCSRLEEVPLYDTRKVNTLYTMFERCTKIKKIPAYDLRNATKTNSLSNTFIGCISLEEVKVKNIATSLQVGSGGTWGHLLTLESLIHLIRELRDTGSLKTFTIGNVNLEKLANVYVRIIDITDEMRVEDDLIDEKLPFEVCESTDEGAMLITDYVALKNWSIA